MKIIKQCKGRSPGSWIIDELHLPLVSGFVMSLQYSGGPAPMHVATMLRLPYYPQRIGGTLTVLYAIAVIISVSNVTVNSSETKKRKIRQLNW